MPDPSVYQTISVPLSLHQRAEAECKEKEISRSALYRTALEFYLDKAWVDDYRKWKARDERAALRATRDDKIMDDVIRATEPEIYDGAV